MLPFEQNVLSENEIAASIQAFKAADFIFNEFHSDAYLSSDAGRRMLAEHLFLRIENNERYILPWLSRKYDLSGKRVLEIGCGSGSASVAFGRRVSQIYSYEVTGFGERSLAAARNRAEALGVTNAEFHLEPPQDICRNICDRFQDDKVDAVLFFAVIEHMTIPERLEALSSYWNILSDDGVFIIGGLPNRLSFIENHSSGLPFYDTLPDELALAYVHNARPYLKNLIEDASDPITMLYRAGRGASFHEFELGLPNINIHDHILLDGFEPEIIDFRGGYIHPEENFRATFFEERNLNLNRAFSKSWLDFVISKKAVLSSHS